MRFVFPFLFAMVGAVLGFLIYLRIPEAYRSSTRLMIEQSSGQVLDVDSEAEPSTPLSFDILQSQLYSDQCAKIAFNDPRMQPFRDRYNGDSKAFMTEVQSSLMFEREVESNEGDEVVALMHYTADDPELVEAALRSFAVALETLLSGAAQSSKSDATQQLNQAIEQLHPKVAEAGKRYRDFRLDSPLVFNADGIAINPHQERVVFLDQKRGKLSEELKLKEIALAQMEAVAEKATDSIVALSVLEKILKLDPILTLGSSPANPADAQKAASEAIASIIIASKAEVKLMKEQSDATGTQIEREKAGAAKLTKYENDNKSMLREIDRYQELMDQLESQIAQIQLNDTASPRVTQLSAPTDAYLAGPFCLKCMGIGSMIGFLSGLLLAMLVGTGRRKQDGQDGVVPAGIVKS